MNCGHPQKNYKNVLTIIFLSNKKCFQSRSEGKEMTADRVSPTRHLVSCQLVVSLGGRRGTLKYPKIMEPLIGWDQRFQFPHLVIISVCVHKATKELPLLVINGTESCKEFLHFWSFETIKNLLWLGLILDQSLHSDLFSKNNTGLLSLILIFFLISRKFYKFCQLRMSS